MNFAPYLQKSLAAIDPSKVLLIVNSSVALSAQVADYYAQARNLGDHRINLALGTGSTINQAGRYYDFIKPVGEYILAHDIECVLLSAGCPWRLLDYRVGLFPGELLAADSGFGAAASWLLNENFWVASYSRHLSYHYGDIGLMHYNDGELVRNSHNGNPVVVTSEPAAPDGNIYAFAKYVNAIWPSVIKSIQSFPVHKGRSIPYGRIGLPKYAAAVPAESFAETKRMIDDALAAEQAGPDSKIAAIGVHARVNSINPPWQWYAWELLRRRGLSANYYVNAWGSASSEWFGKQPDYDYAALMAGNEAVEAWAWLGGAIMNEPTANPYAASLQPVPGAWGFEATSNGTRFAADLIMRGGCAAIGSELEPFEQGLPDVASIASILARGYSLAEANWFTSPSPWRVSVLGDPLYRPFRALGLSDGELLSIRDVTPGKITINDTAPRQCATITPLSEVADITSSRAATWIS